MILAQSTYALTLEGWIFMVASVGFVTALLIWSVGRVLRGRHVDRLRSQNEIDPPDKTTDD